MMAVYDTFGYAVGVLDVAAEGEVVWVCIRQVVSCACGRQCNFQGIITSQP